jgi:branched-chain amino acid transport system permease protein
MITQQILNGIVVGAVYALFSLGLTLVYGLFRILNLAHGAVFMCGSMAGLFAIEVLKTDLLLAFVLAMLFGGLVSVALELLVFRPLRKRKGDELSTIVASIGANLILMNLAQQVTNSETLRFPFGTFPIRFYGLFDVRVSAQDIAILVSAAIMVGTLVLYVFRTSLGAKLRAVAVNERTSALLGVNAGPVYLQTFFIAGAMAGAAGMIVGIAFNAVSYTMGENMMLQAFVVIVLGGLGSVAGTVTASLLIGLIQTLSIAYVSSQLSDAILFGILFLVLWLYPSGLLTGLHTEQRAA